jgi:hypothetical protein
VARHFNITKKIEAGTLVAALIAAVASVSGVGFTLYGTAALERAKWAQARDDEARKNLRLAIADLARELSTLAQRAAWLLWTASHTPGSLAETDLAAYEADARAGLPKLVSAQILLAAHDKPTYDRLLPVVQQFYELDEAIARATTEFRRAKPAGLQALASC